VRRVALSAVAIAAPAAEAETKVIAASGSWVAFGGTTDKGKPVCGVSQSAGDVYFGFKFFDDNATWNATATGFHFNDGDPVLEFRNSAQLRMRFPESMTPDLVLSLNGTGALMDPLLACIRNLR
jgi:hypothetical protein